MKVYKTYRIIGLDAFTLMLNFDLSHGNHLTTSIPKAYLRANIDGHLKQLKYAYIPNTEIAYQWLDKIAKLIFKKKDSYFYFYKAYLQRNRTVDIYTIKYIMSYIDDPQTQSLKHYSSLYHKVDFFILNSILIAEWNFFNNLRQEVSIDEFKSSLITTEMQEDFYYQIEDDCKAYVIKRYNTPKFYFLFTNDGRLLMVVNR